MVPKLFECSWQFFVFLLYIFYALQSCCTIIVKQISVLKLLMLKVLLKAIIITSPKKGKKRDKLKWSYKE